METTKSGTLPKANDRLETEENTWSLFGFSASKRSTIRTSAAAAFLVFGLAACGGAATAVDSAASVADEEDAGSEFLSAGTSSDDSPPEALAAVALDSEASAAVIGADSPTSPPGVDGNHALLSEGEIFLRGTVPNQEIVDLSVTAFEEIFGDGNVIAEFSIDPNSTFDEDTSQAVFLADDVLFNSGSADLKERFETVLAFTPRLLEVQPGVTLWVKGHTDSVGDDDANLALSEARVNAVSGWIIERGGDPERIFAVGEGETNPIADNETEEGRQLNRRVEFIVDNFDIGL